MTFTELKAAVIAELTARDPRDTYCSIRVEDTHYHTGRENQEWTVYAGAFKEQFRGPTPEAAGAVRSPYVELPSRSFADSLFLASV